MSIELERADGDSMCASIVFRVYDDGELIDRISIGWGDVEEELRERHGDELVDLWDECCYDKSKDVGDEYCYDKSKLDKLDPVTYEIVKSFGKEYDKVAQELAESYMADIGMFEENAA